MLLTSFAECFIHLFVYPGPLLLAWMSALFLVYVVSETSVGFVYSSLFVSGRDVGVVHFVLAVDAETISHFQPMRKVDIYSHLLCVLLVGSSSLEPLPHCDKVPYISE